MTITYFLDLTSRSKPVLINSDNYNRFAKFVTASGLFKKLAAMPIKAKESRADDVVDFVLVGHDLKSPSTRKQIDKLLGGSKKSEGGSDGKKKTKKRASNLDEDVQEAVDRALELIEAVDNCDESSDFLDSVKERTQDIIQTMTDGNFATKNQRNAIESWFKAVERKRRD